MNGVNSRSDFGHNNSTVVVVIIIIFYTPGSKDPRG